MIGYNELFKAKFDALKRLAKSLGIEEKRYTNLNPCDKKKLVRMIHAAMYADESKISTRK